MYMEQLIAGWPPAEQALGAHRWGLPITTPRILAGLLRDPKTAGRVCRRGADAGAPEIPNVLALAFGEDQELVPALMQPEDNT